MATRIADIARDDDGVAVSGASVSLRRESDNFELATTTTDANGYFAFSEATVGYPGPVKVVVTDVNGNVRQHSGRTTGQVGTIFMSDLNRAFLMMTDGIVGGVGGELAVSSTGLTMNLTIASGELYAYGHPCIFPAGGTVTPAANASGNPRVDLVVVRLIPPGVAEEGKRTFALVQGTPAASPVTPSATKSTTTVWEVALASVRVESGATSIAADKVVDLRGYSSGPLQNSSVTTAILNNLSVTTPKVAPEAITIAKMNAEGQLSTADSAKVLKAPTSGNVPVYGSIATSEISDISSDIPTANQVLMWNTTDSRYKPTTLTNNAIVITVQEGDVTVDAAVNTLDFLGSKFDVTSTPAGEANITLAADSITATELAALSVGNAELQTGLDATKIGGGLVTSTEFNQLADISTASSVQTQIDGKAGLSHNHLLNNPPTGFATKTYAFTGVTSTATDGVEIAGFDMNVPSNGGTVFATAAAQCGAPSSGGTFLEIGVKIGSQSTDWGMRTQTVGGERDCNATSTRVYGSGAATQRISLRARVDAGTGAGVNAAHINAICVSLTVTA